MVLDDAVVCLVLRALMPDGWGSLSQGYGMDLAPTLYMVDSIQCIRGTLTAGQ